MPANDDIAASRVTIDSREHELLYKLFLECLVVQSKGVRATFVGNRAEVKPAAPPLSTPRRDS